MPNPSNPQAWNRFSYVHNRPVNLNDPSGHCGADIDLLMPGFSMLASCIQDVSDAIYAYNNGERDIVRLTAKATGFDDWAQKAGNRIDEINKNMSMVFSNAPVSDRIGPAVDIGWTAVSNAANILAIGQSVRGISAFTRNGAGGAAYKVPGTERNIVYDVGDELYRVYGNASPRNGSWAFTTNPGNQISAIRGGALPPGNGTTSITRITFSGPVEAEASTVAKLFGMPGGYTQIKLPFPPSANIIYGQGTSLPKGFMPFVPPQVGSYLRNIFK